MVEAIRIQDQLEGELRLSPRSGDLNELVAAIVAETAESVETAETAETAEVDLGLQLHAARRGDSCDPASVRPGPVSGSELLFKPS